METKTCKTTHNQSVDDRELDASAQDLMRELLEMRGDPKLCDGEITINDYIEHFNVKESYARTELTNFFHSGFLSRRKERRGRTNFNVYKKADSDISTEELFAWLKENQRYVRPGEIIARDYAVRAGIAIKTATSQLRQMEKRGELVSRRAVYEGCYVKAYSRPDD